MGLSYAESWVPEWRTQFCDVTFPRGRLEPRETQTFELAIPVLRSSLLEGLRQQAVLYGYEDPDPDHDYVGLYITAGTQRHCTFIPFGE